MDQARGMITPTREEREENSELAMEMDAMREERDPADGMFLTPCDLMMIEDPALAMGWDTDPNVIRMTRMGDLNACAEPQRRAEQNGIEATFERRNYEERNPMPEPEFDD